MFQSTLSILLLLAASASAARILLMPFDHKGHVNFFGVTAKNLQDKGHEVLLLTQERHQGMLEKVGIPFILNPTKDSLSPTENYATLSEALFGSGFTQVRNLINFAHNMTVTSLAYCREVIANKEIMDTIKNKNFDIALIDGVDTSRCFYIIPYKFDIPYISLTARHDPWVARVPAMPSGEGQFGLIQLGKDPSFFDRVKNLFLYTMLYIVSPPPPQNDEQVLEMAPEKPPITYQGLFKRSEVFLINTDNYCMDYPRVEAPHYHFIGGAAAHPPKPLPKEFDDFVSKAEHGLIVVSFGSLVKTAPFDLVTKLMEVFRKIPQRVVMRYEGKWENVPENVMLSKWLPQNDLIGHKKTVLYIAHGGNNGQTEGHYHGVPMVVIPFGGDQIYAATRVEMRKFGKFVNHLDCTSEQLYNDITEVISNHIYKKNIEKCSQIIKSFPSAHDMVEFWVNHIIQFGGSHLRPMYMDMPLYKYFMLDVLLVLFVTVSVLMYGIAKCCCCVKRRFCSKQDKTKTE